MQLVTTKAHLARAKHLCRTAKRVAIDCEGVQLSHSGRLCLVQVVLSIIPMFQSFTHGIELVRTVTRRSKYASLSQSSQKKFCTSAKARAVMPNQGCVHTAHIISLM